MHKAFAFLIVFCCTSAAQATLIDRGNGMIYDDVLNMTWLTDANLGGSMNWVESMDWADNLVFGGFDDWRLPSMDRDGDDTIVFCDFVSQAECRDNELGYMFYYNLGGMLGDDLRGDQGFFTNIQGIHWSGTDFSSSPDLVWMFTFQNGNQVGFLITGSSHGAWAVRSGDVLAAAEPGTLALLGLGLAGFGLSRRRR